MVEEEMAMMEEMKVEEMKVEEMAMMEEMKDNLLY
jgi:hypothetical protein